MKQYGLLFVFCLLSLAACNKNRGQTKPPPPPPNGNILFKTELNNAEYSDLELTIIDENQEARKQALTDFKLEQGVHNIRIDAQQGLKCELDVQPDPDLASTQILKVNCQDAPLKSQYAYLNLGSKDTDVSLAGVEVKLEGIVSNDTITMETDEVTVTITQTSTSSGKKTFLQESKLSQLKVSTQATEFKVVNIETQLGSEDGSEFLTDESGRLTLRYDSRLFSGDNLEHLPLLIATFQCSQDLTASECQLRHPVRVALTADQFLSEQWSAHPLTEAVYQTLRYYLLAGYGIDQIMEYMNGLSDYLFISENGGHYESLLNWNPEEENKIYQAEKVRGLGDLLLSKEISEEEISSDIEQKIQEIISLEYIVLSSEGSLGLNTSVDPETSSFFISPFSLNYEYKMQVLDGYAYAPDGENGFIRINIADPKKLKGETMSVLGAVVTAVAVKDQYAFITTGPYVTKDTNEEHVAGLHSVNLETLEVSSSLPLEGDAQNISIYDASAFVAAGSAGLYEIDISNPNQLKIIHQFEGGNITDVIVHKGNLFKIIDAKWLEYIPLKELDQKEVSFTRVKFPWPYFSHRVGMYIKFDGDSLYYACLEIIPNIGNIVIGLILNILDGGNPFKLESPLELTKAVQGFSYKLAKFNISNLQEVEMVGDPVIIDGRPTSIDVDGDIAYVATANPVQDSSDPIYALFDIYGHKSGITIVDFSDKNNISTEFLKTGHHVYSVVFDQNLYVRGRNKFDVLSTNKKLVEPLKENECVFPHKILDLQMEGDLAYLAAGVQGLQVIDASCNKIAAFSDGFKENFKFTRNLVIEDGTAYLVNTWGGLELVNISMPNKEISPVGSLMMEPEELSKEDNLFGFEVKNMWPHSTAVAVWPPYIYTAFSRLDYLSKKGDPKWNRSTLMIAPIQNPGAVVGRKDFPGSAESIAIHGDYAYVAQGNEGLRVINIKDPNQLDDSALFEAIKAVNLVIKDQYAYVATDPDKSDEPGRLVILDLSDPENLTIKSETEVTGRVSEILVDGPYAYVSDDRAGFSVLDIRDVNKPLLLGRYQNSGQIESMQIVDGKLHISNGYQYTQLRALPHSIN